MGGKGSKPAAAADAPFAVKLSDDLVVTLSGRVGLVEVDLHLDGEEIGSILCPVPYPLAGFALEVITCDIVTIRACP